MLQQDQNSYAGTTDTWIIGAQPTVNKGADQALSARSEPTDSTLIRFAIFAAEGGPVPNGATITSATLSLYKWAGPDAVFKASRMLKDWSETQATWNLAATDAAWTTPGAQSADNDFVGSADGQASIGDAAGCTTAPFPATCWLNIDVTAGVQAFASGTSNYGWKIAQVSSTVPGNYKHFNSSENTGFPTLRPKLTIAYDTTTACNSGSSRPYDQAPVSGSPIVIASSGTTTFEAEHFNCGGEDQGYNDTNTTNNPGQTFRSTEGVEIIGAPGGLAINQFEVGEWLAYTINVATAGTYDLGILASASSSGGGFGAFRIEIDGTDVTGTVSVPVTAGWEDYQWVNAPGVSLAAGTHVLRLVAGGTYFRTDKIRLVPSAPAVCNAGASRPYGAAPVNGVAIAVPSSGATFEAEHYNCGAEGQGYHDTNAGVNEGQTFRADNEVEIIAAPGGVAVNRFDTGEWLEYTINVQSAGSYKLGISASNSPSSTGSGTFRFEIGGTAVGGNVTVTQGTGWEDYRWFDTAPVTLTVGTHRLRLVSVLQSFRIDKLRVIPGTQPLTGCGSADFCISFETGDTVFGPGAQITTTTLGSQTWVVENKANCADQSLEDCHDRIHLVDTSRDGGKALRIGTLKLDTCVVHPTNDCVMERSEIRLGTQATASSGTQWWAHSLLIPGDSTIVPNSGELMNVLQFATQVGGNFQLSINTMQAGGLPKMTYFRAWSGGDGGINPIHSQYNYRHGAGTQDGQCIFDDVTKDVWYDFVHRITWASGGAGRHEIWMRKAGGPVRKVLDRGVGAIAPLNSPINTLYAGVANEVKFGAYHNIIDNFNTFAVHDRIRRSNLGGSAGADAVRLPDFPVDLAANPLNPDGSFAGCSFGRP